MHTLIICSGGLDSITLAHHLHNEGGQHHMISFNYGQRHLKELEYAKQTAEKLNIRHDNIDISSLRPHLSGSSLTDEVNIPEGWYSQHTMKSTVVPNRNAILLTIAFAIATARGLKRVSLAVHGGDHFIYPDCREHFCHMFQKMQNTVFEEEKSAIELYTPFIKWKKSDIVKLGHELGVPFQETWSCYKGMTHHCGRCGTCVERQEAFELAKVKDPTHYEDLTFYQTIQNTKEKNHVPHL